LQNFLLHSGGHLFHVNINDFILKLSDFDY
jgi:hypothetical protein